MTNTTPATETPSTRTGTDFRLTFFRYLRRAWLAGSAGGVAGFLIGGVGGRLAMFVLRLTSDARLVRGAESDDGFTIGRFSFATVFLLLLTTALGSVAGLAYAAVRSAFPARARRACWATVCGAIGGAALVRKDGIDFRILEPVSLAITLFIAIPAGGAWLMAYLVDRWEPWWGKDRTRTAVASLFALPASMAGIGIVPGAAIVVAAVAAFGLQLRLVHRVNTQLVLRVSVCLVFVALTSIAIVNLTGDVRDLM